MQVFVRNIDHVQLAMPPGEEERARTFYAGVLGLTEVLKPAELAKRGDGGETGDGRGESKRRSAGDRRDRAHALRSHG